ncbi:nucleosome assembly protein 1, partial [Aphelenchoides avenae]
GFTLRFHFEPNEYFANTVLEKYYKLQLTPDADDPSCYDGPKPTATRGTKIQWKHAKNVTQENAENDAGRTVTSAEKDNSFLYVQRSQVTLKQILYSNFFDPPITEMSKELSGPASEAFREDYDIGKDILDLIIPQAVFHYTGELAEDDGLYFVDESEDGGVVFYD